ncbi:MAG: hypothetical protein QMC79_06540 [Anaerosomatales bacterium]|nr:hypothetical protein [Anaerosomatales bacterium]
MRFPDDTHESLARVIDAVFASAHRAPRLEIITRAHVADLPAEVLGLLDLLPPGTYTRQRLCDQLNSAITGHGWGSTLGTFE